VFTLAVRHSPSSLAVSDLQTTPDTNGRIYYLRLCGTLNSSSSFPNVHQCMAQDPLTSACENGRYNYDTSLGEWNPDRTPVWSYINDTSSLGVQFTMQGTQQWYVMRCSARLLQQSIFPTL